MINLTELNLGDATIKAIRVTAEQVEVDYADWQANLRSVVFDDVISCLIISAHGKVLSHGQIDMDAAYIAECCAVAEEDSVDGYSIYSFIDAWANRKIVSIVAKGIRVR